MSFVEMVEPLLSTIHLIWSVDWELLLECIRRVAPYRFAFDHINYASYLPVMLGDILQLPNDYEKFMGGKFAVQLTENTEFSTDKVIEVSLNKDTKTPSIHYVFNKE